MEDIRKICHERIVKHLSQNLKIELPTIVAIDIIIDDHIRLFQAQDDVYVHLHLIDPTPTEMEETRDHITIMEELWCRMELSVTPKAHMIFVHAADDQVKFGGLGDKIEDPIEKRHQEQLRLDAILNKMSCGFEQKMRTQLKYEWRNSNPLVIEQIEKVNLSSTRKRKRIDVPLGGCDRQATMKLERQLQRSKHIDDIKTTMNE